MVLLVSIWWGMMVLPCNMHFIKCTISLWLWESIQKQVLGKDGVVELNLESLLDYMESLRLVQPFFNAINLASVQGDTVPSDFQK